jgi:hypothetical protein
MTFVIPSTTSVSDNIAEIETMSRVDFLEASIFTRPAANGDVSGCGLCCAARCWLGVAFAEGKRDEAVKNMRAAAHRGRHLTRELIESGAHQIDVADAMNDADPD